MTQKFDFQFTADASALGKRLDQVLAEACREVSRSRLQEWIAKGWISVDGAVINKQRHKLSGGEFISIEAEIEQAGEWLPENIPLHIVHEDDELIVVNKSPDMVVHPAPGNLNGTLVNALLHHASELKLLPRAGIIHRLDKDTSGLLVVAKTLNAHSHLVAQLQDRAFEREYQCLCHGQMIAGGTVEQAIGRHPQNRILMAVTPMGKEAITHYRIKQKFNDFTELQVNLETGRTHQIRVHMAHLRYPIVGDQLYGRANYVPSGCSDRLKLQLRAFKRQALHARKLGLVHPSTGDMLSWEVEPPQDYQQLLQTVEQENGQV
ncbi:MAG: 23S rRNA pseudouridine(1911/1915/1917) synthase RluD [Kangiellaceae bacterium]|jgi:23S rRNA pseudouridine1911/1915/1917 synthase|nr:23S rRNA pseudouridine(1911/1915/1917) synthase RluD [Kangiellaceae bacterium]